MLHTVNKSPFEKNSLETCLRLADSNSSILLIEDGVYGALKNTLYEKSIIESDFEKRTKMYQELDQIIMNNAVIIPLYYDQVLRFSHKNIKGFYANAQNLLDLTKVEKE